MDRHRCEQAGVPCPYQEKIAATYEKVITGNSERPLPERVRNLEGQMSTVLPILNDLKSAFERQEGRELERSADAAREREKEDRWRWIFGTLLTILTLAVLLYTALEANRQVYQGKIHLPKIGVSDASAKVYSAHVKQPAQDAANSAAYTTAGR